MRVFQYTVLAIAVLLFSAEASAEIFKCEDPEGGIVYQQTPCPEREAAEPDEYAEEDSPSDQATIREPPPFIADEDIPDRTEAEIESCKTKYRDAIDDIDAEMRAGFTPEQGEAFKQRLRLLTQQLRAC